MATERKKRMNQAEKAYLLKRIEEITQVLFSKASRMLRDYLYRDGTHNLELKRYSEVSFAYPDNVLSVIKAYYDGDSRMAIPTKKLITQGTLNKLKKVKDKLTKEIAEKEAEFKKVELKILRRRDVLRDEIMLGDVDEAFGQLQAFADMKL